MELTAEEISEMDPYEREDAHDMRTQEIVRELFGCTLDAYPGTRRPELMKDTSCRPGPAAFKLGAERFKQLDAETRAKYEKIDEAAKQEYEEKLAAYKDAGGTMKKNAKKKEKRKKNAEGSRRSEENTTGREKTRAR